MAKRILFVITQSEFGGAQRFLSTLQPRLDAHEYDILVATGSTGDEHFTDHLKNIGIANTVLPSLVRDLDPIKDIKAISEIRKLISDFKPDTLFLLSSKAGFLGAWAARNYKVKVIYRIGGWAFNDPQSAIRKNVLIKAEKFSAQQKDIIILNNTHDLEQAKSLGIAPRQKLAMIHNGIDVTKLKLLSREAARAKLGLPAHGLFIGTIANYYPSKGLPDLVKTARLVPDLPFVIIGDGKVKPPHADNVRLLGRIPEASRYLLAFDIFVSPSLKEGFPWAVLEAMAAGVPTIATRVGASPEVIQDGINGILAEAGQPEQLAEKINHLAHDMAARSRFAEAGRTTVEQNFNLDTMVEETKKLL